MTVESLFFYIPFSITLSVGSLSMKTLSAPWLTHLSWDELATLLICVSLDIVEYILPMLMVPIAGDIIDFAGFVFCIFYFGWLGFLALFDLIPGLDILPSFTIAWLVWYMLKRRNDRLRLENELDQWR